MGFNDNLERYLTFAAVDGDNTDFEDIVCSPVIADDKVSGVPTDIESRGPHYLFWLHWRGGSDSVYLRQAKEMLTSLTLMP